MTDKFEFLAFLDQCSKIHWIKTSLEIKLDAFKKKNTNAETKEQDAMIEILRFQYVWLHDLEREYHTMSRVSLENNRNNLFLMNRITELEAENKKLKLTIESL